MPKELLAKGAALPPFRKFISAFALDAEHPLNMPELNWPFGYLLCLGVMACIGTGMVIFFKRKNLL